MDITTTRKDLAVELSLCASVAARKATIPITTCVRLTAGEPGELTLTATDLELSLRTACPAEVRAVGDVAVRAGQLAEVVAQLPEGSISFTLGKNTLAIRAGSYRGAITAYPAADHPAIPLVTARAVRVQREALLRSLRRVGFALGESGPGAGLLLTGGDAPDVMRLVATDGHRLALADCPAPGVREWPDVVVARRAALEVAKLLAEDQPGEAAELVALSADDRQLAIVVGSRRLFVQLMSATFPAYRRVIPQSNGLTTVSRADLQAAIRRVTAIGGDNVKLTASDGQLRLAAREAQAGEAEDHVVATSADALETILFARYVIQFLETQDAESVTLATANERAAVVWRPVGDASTLYVVMPRASL